MSLGIDDLELSEELSSYLEWALQKGIWDGRQVSYAEASDFCEEIQQRILQLFFENPDHPLFVQLAVMGASSLDRALCAREIQKLDFSKDDLILQAGFTKKAKKFWKKHKKEILIAAIAVAVVTVVAVVVISSGGTATGVATAAANAVLAASKEEEERKKKPDPQNNSPKQENSPPPPPEPTASLEAPVSRKNLVFDNNGVWLLGNYSGYQDLLFNHTWAERPVFTPPEIPDSLASFMQKETIEEVPWNHLSKSTSACEAIEALSLPDNPSIPGSNPENGWIAALLDMIGREVLDIPAVVKPLPERSARFSTLGEKMLHLCIGGVNGINTSMDGAVSHANYIAGLAEDHCIDWVYNCSHGAAIDLLEVFALNYWGCSPNTAQLLLENWEAFAKENVDNPKMRYLQFCHSQGAIHVRNALANAPQEIRDRVIVVAIAPAVIIDQAICFKSVNLASKKDVVHYGELIYPALTDAHALTTSRFLEMTLEQRSQLILLDPHPDATGIDHDFQSPTFRRPILDIVIKHINLNGEYE